jgi:cytochrome c oxidase subunit 4
MAGILNLFSLVLGIIAWTLPVVSLMRYNNRKRKNWAVLSIISISACSISLCFQIFYNYYLVKLEDWSALMDTMGAVMFSAAVLLTVTITLNMITLIVYRRRTTE